MNIGYKAVFAAGDRLLSASFLDMTTDEREKYTVEYTPQEWVSGPVVAGQATPLFLFEDWHSANMFRKLMSGPLQIWECEYEQYTGDVLRDKDGDIYVTSLSPLYGEGVQEYWEAVFRKEKHFFFAYSVVGKFLLLSHVAVPQGTVLAAQIELLRRCDFCPEI